LESIKKGENMDKNEAVTQKEVLNQEEKAKVLEVIVGTMLEYKGFQKDRVRAMNYLNIDDSGPTVAEKILEKLEEIFIIKPRDGTMRWSD